MTCIATPDSFDIVLRYAEITGGEEGITMRNRIKYRLLEYNMLKDYFHNLVENCINS